MLPAALLTLAAWQWSAPLEVRLTLQGFVVTQGVARVTAECHQRSHVEIIPVALPIDRDARIQAVVRLELHSCGKQSQGVVINVGGRFTPMSSPKVLPITPNAGDETGRGTELCFLPKCILFSF